MTKDDYKGFTKYSNTQKTKISLNEESNFNYNHNTNSNYNSTTKNLHKDTNTLSPLNKDNPAGILYSPNCENFQKRTNA
jgi:hypothetical protein